MERGEHFPMSRNYNNQHPSQDITNNPMNIQLTPDELKILKECQYNSIMHRGLPLAAICAGGLYYLMKNKVVKQNSFSLAISGLSGFFFGILSYRQVCIDKLMTLPHSTLKERILIAQGKQSHVRVEVPSQDPQMWFDASPAPQAPMMSSLDIEPYNQSDQFGDYSNRHTDAETSFAITPPLQSSANTPYQTYDDLRRVNREQYENARNFSARRPERTDTMRRNPSDFQSSPYGQQNEPEAPPRKKDDFLW